MTRDELQRYIFDHYSTEPDYPWADAPNHAVFRHGGNRKWRWFWTCRAISSVCPVRR